VQASLQRYQKAGGDPSQIARLLQQFGTLMREQKYDRAIELLGRALKMIDEQGQ